MSLRGSARYNSDMENTDAAHSTVRRWRGEISRAVGLASSGPLSVVLAAEGCGHCYVVKVLDVHPCLGKVKGRRLLSSLGVSASTRMEDLGDKERAAISGSCGCADG